MYVTEMRPLHYFHLLRTHTTANRQPRLKMRVNTCVIVLRSPGREHEGFLTLIYEKSGLGNKGN